MGYLTKEVRQSLPWTDVFQHHADDLETTRRNIAENVCLCIESGSPLINPSPPLNLYYGTYNLRGDKDVNSTLGELIWKQSELTGKYIGCPYWSLKAKTLFDQVCQGVANPTLQDAWQLAPVLGVKKRGKMRLVHEHVFPRKHLRPYLLQGRGKHQDLASIEQLMNRMAIGCVILEDEHPDHSESDWANPWLRYKGIVLAENKQWDPLHRDLIHQATLLN